MATAAPPADTETFEGIAAAAVYALRHRRRPEWGVRFFGATVPAQGPPAGRRRRLLRRLQLGLRRVPARSARNRRSRRRGRPEQRPGGGLPGGHHRRRRRHHEFRWVRLDVPHRGQLRRRIAVLVRRPVAGLPNGRSPGSCRADRCSRSVFAASPASPASTTSRSADPACSAHRIDRRCHRLQGHGLVDTGTWVGAGHRLAARSVLHQPRDVPLDPRHGPHRVVRRTPAGYLLHSGSGQERDHPGAAFERSRLDHRGSVHWRAARADRAHGIVRRFGAGGGLDGADVGLPADRVRAPRRQSTWCHRSRLGAPSARPRVFRRRRSRRAGTTCRSWRSTAQSPVPHPTASPLRSRASSRRSRHRLSKGPSRSAR